ncbi:hypothetical protein J1N35_013118, partial [Gossypium stocksii]
NFEEKTDLGVHRKLCAWLLSMEEMKIWLFQRNSALAHAKAQSSRSLLLSIDLSIEVKIQEKR